jgi:exosortase
MLLVGVLYWDPLRRLVADWWRDPNFSHGFLVPLFSAYVVWTRRERLRHIPTLPSYWGVAVILVGIVALVGGTFGAELFLTRFSFVVMIAGLLIYFFGFKQFRVVLFPWACLFLMIPIPAIIFNQVTFPLQMLASQLAGGMLRLAGIPVLREGNVIQLPAMRLEVAEACSGIRSLMSLATLAIIYGYAVEPRKLIRIILIVAAVPIAVAANALRIFGTGVLVEYWDPQKALGFFHEFSGWLIFLLALSLLFGFHRMVSAIASRRTCPDL